MQTNMSNNSNSTYPYHCLDSRTAQFIFFAFMVTKMLLLVPLSVLVLYLGYKQWWRQRSFATTSHSNIFTFHVAAMDLIFAFECTAFICGAYTGLPKVVTVGFCVFCLVLFGQMCFHILTCVERYLAVVNPVTYLGLRHSGGDKIRNICIVFVWLLSFGWSGVAVQYMPDLPIILLLSTLVFSLIVVSFCSLFVLCVLFRPGPGEVGGDRDQFKKRAFHTITAIMGVLWFWFAGILVCLALYYSQLLGHSDGCLVVTSGFWFSLPSSLVLPLLFLLGAGKLPCCHQSNE